MSLLYYFKQNIKAEPYIWNWYAWPYLICPSTAACNIVERHIKIMQSYILNPQLHANAVKDPKMIGGPFLDLDEKELPKLQNILDQTFIMCSDLISLNSALKNCDELLQSQATGGSLQNLYQAIPEMLRGLIELVYDSNSNPSMRLIEPMIYKYYYNDNNQAIVLSTVENDYRKFVLSTPRITSEDSIEIKLPFSSTEWDSLFRAREVPVDQKNITKMFNIIPDKAQLFESFFSPIAPIPKNDRQYNGEGTRIRYFGHACMLFQTNDISILFDPVISYKFEGTENRYTFEDLPEKIDYVILTHNHQDHCMIETLLQLRYKIKNVVCPFNQKGSLLDPSLKMILRHIGFNRVIEMDELDILQIGLNNTIIALPFLGEHSDLNIYSKLAYCIKSQGKTFMFAADSSNLDEVLYDRIYDIIGDVDMLFIGMECNGAPLSWLYGPLLTKPISRVHDRSRTLSGSDFNQAWSVVNKLKCKHAYVYAMGQEPWLSHVMGLIYTPDSVQIMESEKFVNACNNSGIKSERLYCKKEWVIE